ncbi:biopolymer transporter ExbD [Limnobacter humi]|uniref:Biopolymer transporter ExbD n=1 Tax=Limnobacter humi TaxID=1778671 RepID=A0ABT1WG87_9BURK|nr:biopolymer transporter ExbD [Limnobacter humi]MCQ8896535.1 biopolymer transporter ExbD [Limnobacter humi]
MKIRRARSSTPPDINFIPLIDVLLVIVIFLVCTTTYVRQSQLKVELPGTQAAQAAQNTEKPLVVKVGADGNYALDGELINSEAVLKTRLEGLLRRMAKPADGRVVIEADATATHQSVVTVMDVLASVGVAKVSIATASTNVRSR